MATPIDPSAQFITVTPNDTIPLNYHGQVTRCRGIYVGNTGDVSIKDDKGTNVLIKNMAAGMVHPFSTDVIRSTNTTATNIIALF